MLRTIAYSQLDPDTKAYLRAVRQARGRGTPGVFEASSDNRAALALILGAIILPVLVCMGYGTNKAAWAMAMIQTAGVMLGGWLILYAFRRWFASMDSYAGKFVYFDPQNVFVGKGEDLQYARLNEDTQVEPAGDNGVRLTIDGRSFNVPVSSRSVATFVADYYDAIDHLNAEDGWWRDESTGIYGAAAKYMVVNERLPHNASEVSLEVDDVPDEVRPARGRPSGVLRYLLILAFGAFIYTGFLFTNRPIHEAGAYANLNQNSPADLRHYIADPNAVANKDEAATKLKMLYATKREQLIARPISQTDIRDAFLTLFDTLDGPEPPVVSIDVTDRAGNAGNTLRTRLADGIGTEVGPEYILFVEKPSDPGRWAMIELSFGPDLGTGGLTWTVAFRRQATDETPYASFTRLLPNVNSLPSEAVYADLMTKLVGNAPPPPQPPPLDDW
ncbi:MAG: hypothetical protein MUF18_05860 [Fimbriiglobus sp.]|jgi:hypothetical protein|nr:hypothetical protein [Fimbriiglobus sp.]